MEFDEHDDPDEEMEIPTGPPGYDSTSTHSRPVTNSEVVGVVVGGGGASSNSRMLSRGLVRYRECLKNHAVNIGGQAVDGCCEFMAAGEEGSINSLRCAACNCHRNFHRKEITDSSSATVAANHHHSQNYLYHQLHHQNFPGGYYPSPPPPPSGYLHVRPLALAGISGGGREEAEDHVSNPSSSGGAGGGGGGGRSSSKKRSRTKFTQEQKERMLAFAESVGWRIQKHDDAAVEQFCADTGVRRQVLKVWMHNNKHTLGKKP